MQNNLQLFAPTNFLMNRINHSRRMDFEREQKEAAAKKAAEEKVSEVIITGGEKGPEGSIVFVEEEAKKEE